MIPEEQQDQAALHALGLLPADEADRLEREMDADAELRDLVRDLREAAAVVTYGLPAVLPPPSVRVRALSEIATTREPVAAAAVPAPAAVVDEAGGRPKVVPFRLPGWVPWAVAASLLALCGVLGAERARLHRELAEARAADPLAGLALFSLTPGNQAPASARATVAWEPGRQQGVLRVSGLPPPEPGKDYQLWVVDAGKKGAISAGVVHVNDAGAALVEFRPVENVVKAAIFALSLERAGGSPTHEGPTLLAPGG